MAGGAALVATHQLLAAAAGAVRVGAGMGSGLAGLGGEEARLRARVRGTGQGSGRIAAAQQRDVQRVEMQLVLRCRKQLVAGAGARNGAQMGTQTGEVDVQNISNCALD